MSKARYQFRWVIISYNRFGRGSHDTSKSSYPDHAMLWLNVRNELEIAVKHLITPNKVVLCPHSDESLIWLVRTNILYSFVIWNFWLLGHGVILQFFNIVVNSENENTYAILATANVSLTSELVCVVISRPKAGWICIVSVCPEYYAVWISIILSRV